MDEPYILSYKQRRAVYEAAFRAFCLSDSRDYAFRQADSVAASFGIAPESAVSLRVSETALDAINDVIRLRRDANKELAGNANDYAASYCSRFINQRPESLSYVK